VAQGITLGYTTALTLTSFGGGAGSFGPVVFQRVNRLGIAMTTVNAGKGLYAFNTAFGRSCYAARIVTVGKLGAFVGFGNAVSAAAALAN